MSLLTTLTTQNDVAEDKDTLGGRSLFDTDIYLMTIVLAYTKASDSSAVGLHLLMKDETGREFQKAVYMTSGKDKGCLNYYTDKNGDKKYLPGFNLANSLSMLTTGKEISAAEEENKVFNIWDSNSKSEVPTTVPALTEIMGKQIYVAIVKQMVDVTKETSQGSKVYQPTGETREENDIEKFFCAREGFEKMTSTEIRTMNTSGDKPEKLFFDSWKEKNAGQVKNKSKGADAATSTTGLKTGGAKAAPGSQKPSTSLFGN